MTPLDPKTGQPYTDPATGKLKLVLNSVRSGATVPIKFEIFRGSTDLTDTSKVRTPLKAEKLASCDSSATVEPVEELAATGGTGLRYDSTAGEFVYNWQTPKVSATTCYKVTVTTVDGSSLFAYFQVTRK